jgi:hypothetical protein
VQSLFLFLSTCLCERARNAPGSYRYCSSRILRGRAFCDSALLPCCDATTVEGIGLALLPCGTAQSKRQNADMCTRANAQMYK